MKRLPEGIKGSEFKGILVKIKNLFSQQILKWNFSIAVDIM